MTFRIATLATAATLLLLTSPASHAAPEFVTAIWKVQSLEFAYQGGSTSYSCNTLQRRLQAILLSVGARDTLNIVMQRCIDQSDAHVRITLASPVEATDANIAAAIQHDSKEELVAKVRNESLPTAETIERFPAMWKTISMARDKELKLDSSDCELVKQLRRDVFPRMSIRIVHDDASKSRKRDNLRCSIAFPNLGQPQLSVAALVAAPAQH